MTGISWAPRIRGFVPAPPGLDGAALIAHVVASLRKRKCEIHAAGDGELVVERGTPGRGSALAFVDANGTIRLDVRGGQLGLAYDFSTAGGLLLCLALSPLCAAAAWFGLGGDPALTAFALLMPVLWLYGANYVAGCIRVPGLLARLCHTAPRGPAGVRSFNP